MKYLIILLAFISVIPVSFSQNTWSHIYSKLTINDVAELQNDLWVATDIGLFQVNKTTLQSVHHTTQNSALPDNHVQTLTTDQLGNLWIGTYELFLIKIGQGGTPWMVATQPDSLQGISLANNNTYSSVVDHNGTVWLSTTLGLLSYDGATWDLNQYRVGFGMAYPMWDLCINSAGEIKTGSFNLLSHDKQSNTFTEHLSPFTSSGILAYSDARMLQKDDTTVFYFADHGGINKVSNGNWESWGPFGGTLPIEPRMDKVSPCIAGDGSIYYNTYTDELVFYNGNQWLIDNSFAQQNTNITSIEHFYIADNGDFWMFQDNLFAKHNATSTTTATLLELVDFNFHSEFTTDKNGVPSIIGYYTGINQYTQGNWSIIPGSDNYTNFGTAFDNSNKAWFMSRDANYYPTIVEQTSNGWFMHDSASTNGVFPTTSPTYATVNFNDLAINSNNVVFVRDYLDKLYKYENGVWSIIQTPGNPSIIHCSPMAADAFGNIWWMESVTVSWGNKTWNLKKYDGTSIQSYATSGGGYVKPYFDANGHLWTSFSKNEINEFDGTSWVSHAIPTNSTVSFITKIGGHIYVGTIYNGLLEFDGQSWTNYTSDNSPLSDNDLRGHCVDQNNNLWLDNSVGQIIDIFNNGMVINSTSAIEEPTAILSVYPNPAKNTIQITTNIKDVEEIQVLNAMGQPMLARAVGNPKQVDVSDLPAGVYWISVRNSKEQLTQAFIKQ